MTTPAITSNNPISIPSGTDGVMVGIRLDEAKAVYIIETQHYRPDSNNIAVLLGQPKQTQYAFAADSDCTTLSTAVMTALNAYKSSEEAGTLSQLAVRAFVTPQGTVDATVAVIYQSIATLSTWQSQEYTKSLFGRIAAGMVDDAAVTDQQFAQLASQVMTAVGVFVAAKGL